MACPYFLPVRRLPDLEGVPGWKMPLGGVFAGECHAREGAPWTPAEGQMRTACNTGYAREQCGRFPYDAKYDIIRFLITEDREPAARLSYVYERDHHPALRGEIELPVDHTGPLQAQAMIYWNSYCRRKWKTQSR